MKGWLKYICLAFVFLNLFSAGLNIILGTKIAVVLMNLFVAGICWYAYIQS